MLAGAQRFEWECEAVLQWPPQSRVWSRDGSIGQSSHPERYI